MTAAPDKYPDRPGLVSPRWGSQRDLALGTHGDKLVQLCELIGEPLLEWQRLLTDVGLEVDSGGRYVHPLVGCVVSRQSGKTNMLVKLILFALFVGDQELILFASQDRQQARVVFEAVIDVVDATPSLKAEVAKQRLMIGIEMIRLRDGSTFRILSTRQSAWRGWSADLVILDELREHTDRSTWSAAMFTMRARPNAQLWFTSTAGTPESVVLRGLVDRGRLSVDDPDDPMVYMEWSCDEIDDLDPADPAMWLLANPTLGSIISEATLAEELRSDPQGFLVEALCIWQDQIDAGLPLVGPEAWLACSGTVDVSSLDRVWLGVDVDQNMSVGHVVAASWVGDRLLVACLETWTDPVEAQVARRIVELSNQLSVSGVAFDPRTASGVVERLSLGGWDASQLHRVAGSLWPRATARLVEHVERGSLLHADDAELSKSLGNTVRVVRPDGSWRFRRRNIDEPITATVALLAAVDANVAPSNDMWLH